MKLITTYHPEAAVSITSDPHKILTAVTRHDELVELRLRFLDEEARITPKELDPQIRSIIVNNPQVLARVAHDENLEQLITDMDETLGYWDARTAVHQRATRRRAIAELEESLASFDLPSDLDSILKITGLKVYDVDANASFARLTFTMNDDGSLTIRVTEKTPSGQSPAPAPSITITDPVVVAEITSDIFIWRKADYTQINDLKKAAAAENPILPAEAMVSASYQGLANLDRAGL